MIRPSQVSRQHRCIVPGCNRPEDRKYRAYRGSRASGYFCTDHGKEVAKRDEADITIPLDSRFLGVTELLH
jgi:hypothetical protein